MERIHFCCLCRETFTSAQIQAVFLSVLALHTHYDTERLCVCVWWGVTINTDLKPDVVGVVGVG